MRKSSEDTRKKEIGTIAVLRGSTIPAAARPGR